MREEDRIGQVGLYIVLNVRLRGELFPRGNGHSVGVSEMVRLHGALSRSASTRRMEEGNASIRKESGCCSIAHGCSEKEQDYGVAEDGNGLKEHTEWELRVGKGKKELSPFSTSTTASSKEKLNLEKQIN